MMHENPKPFQKLKKKHDKINDNIVYRVCFRFRSFIFKKEKDEYIFKNSVKLKLIRIKGNKPAIEMVKVL